VPLPDPSIAPWVKRIREQVAGRTGRATNREYMKLYRLEELRSYMETHLGATSKECAYYLKWPVSTTRMYTRMIRKEWKSR
jgi:hypothetical protein